MADIYSKAEAAVGPLVVGHVFPPRPEAAGAESQRRRPWPTGEPDALPRGGWTSCRTETVGAAAIGVGLVGTPGGTATVSARTGGDRGSGAGPRRTGVLAGAGHPVVARGPARGGGLRA